MIFEWNLYLFWLICIQSSRKWCCNTILNRILGSKHKNFHNDHSMDKLITFANVLFSAKCCIVLMVQTQTPCGVLCIILYYFWSLLLCQVVHLQGVTYRFKKLTKHRKNWELEYCTVVGNWLLSRSFDPAHPLRLKTIERMSWWA